MQEVTTKTWQTLLAVEKQQPYFHAILDFLSHERASGKMIYPPTQDVFNALKYTPFNDVRVVILGQDPYHGSGQAHGLCFSVQPGTIAPPSLKNIFRELHSDLGIPTPDQGCLEKWTKQGVLLLNTVLTVEAGKAHSHANIGWEIFTDKIIQLINTEKQGVVFLLWGSHAQKKAQMIDLTRHSILETVHPSPLSAHRGFLGSKHFSKTNQLLRQMGLPEVDWRL